MDRSSLYFQVITEEFAEDPGCCALSVLKQQDSAQVVLMNLDVVACRVLFAVFNPIFSNQAISSGLILSFLL